MIEAKDTEIGVLRSGLDAERELRRRLELRVAELERRLDQDSADSGTPTSKESIGARERRKARRRQRQESERDRRKDRKPGGQPGHPGIGLSRDPDPDETKPAEPPAECRRCKAPLAGAAIAGSRWAQVFDVEVVRKVTEWLLPGLECPCCQAVTFAGPPPGAHAGSVSYGPVLNAAAVVLTAYGNVPPERAAQVMGMLLGVPVSPGWVDKANTRLAAQLGKAGLDAVMLAALAAQDALAADEAPVNVLTPTPPAAPGEAGEHDPDEHKDTASAGTPHVLTIRTPDGLLTWLQALGSRRKADVGAGIPAAFSGLLMTDGYTGYQHLLSRLAGIQQCSWLPEEASSGAVPFQEANLPRPAKRWMSPTPASSRAALDGPMPCSSSSVDPRAVTRAVSSFLIALIFLSMAPSPLISSAARRRRVLPGRSRGRIVAIIALACCADRNCFAPPGNSSSSRRCSRLIVWVRARPRAPGPSLARHRSCAKSLSSR